jgi:hypothetical protein
MDGMGNFIGKPVTGTHDSRNAKRQIRQEMWVNPLCGDNRAYNKIDRRDLVGCMISPPRR